MVRSRYTRNTEKNIANEIRATRKGDFDLHDDVMDVLEEHSADWVDWVEWVSEYAEKAEQGDFDASLLLTIELEVNNLYSKIRPVVERELDIYGSKVFETWYDDVIMNMVNWEMLVDDMGAEALNDKMWSLGFDSYADFED